MITYTGSGGVLPAYAPSASGTGTINYIKLSGTATAPLAGVISADNSTIYVGTQTDNLVHLITRGTASPTTRRRWRPASPLRLASPFPLDLLSRSI